MLQLQFQELIEHHGRVQVRSRITILSESKIIDNAFLGSSR